MATAKPISQADSPRHIAIIMDGNGRWAKRRKLPRAAGHRAGMKTAKRTVLACAKMGVEVVTLFAFSSENWLRPKEEVSVLMDLFLRSCQNEISSLHEHNIRLRFIGDTKRLTPKLVTAMAECEAMTINNTGLLCLVAVDYGGRWDLTQAMKNIVEKVQRGEITIATIDEQTISNHLTTANLPDPDLFIRTSGEQRLSNFLIWQISYTELYFCDCHWPDFDEKKLQKAIIHFRSRQRRFGKTAEQIARTQDA